MTMVITMKSTEVLHLSFFVLGCYYQTWPLILEQSKTVAFPIFNEGPVT